MEQGQSYTSKNTVMTQMSGWCIIWSLIVTLPDKEIAAMSGDMIGRTIKGRYKLIDERGRGSFATVYVARDIENNHIYALKVMHIELSNDDELLARFQREAHILLNLSDPHIV
ncbi:MAG: hypothetical protein JO215_16705, partial [Ktedonobacteraceae bacterium]|nr:hypothetical protein [Ktedonobacteraceae bacterium]